MIFAANGTVDPFGVPVVRLTPVKRKTIKNRLRVEDKTSNYIRYREDNTGVKWGHWINGGE